MKFSSALLAALVSVFFSSILFSCAANPGKAKGEVTVKDSAEKNSSSENKPAIPTSVLPAGPATPNPYLQIKPSISPAAEASFREATHAMQQKNWTQAEILLQPLAETYPKLSGVQLNLGIVYRARGDKQKAAAAFAQAIKANTKNLDAYNQLAVLKRESGNFSEAEALYLQALAVWPFHPDSQKNIAILYELYMGKPEQALPHYLAYQKLLAAPDKQVDSWIADLQRRLNGGKKAAAAVQADETDSVNAE